MPIMIVQYGWTHDFASYLGSANLLGYLVGALLALFSIKEKSIPALIITSAVLGSKPTLLFFYTHAFGLVCSLAHHFRYRRWPTHDFGT